MNEKLEILQMIRENRITPEEGVRLLEALDRSDSPGPSPENKTRGARGEAKWLNIEVRIRAGSSFKSLTPVRIPFSVVRVFFKFMTNASFPKNDFDPEEIIKTLEEGVPLEFIAEDGGRAIRISAE